MLEIEIGVRVGRGGRGDDLNTKGLELGVRFGNWGRDHFIEKDVAVS